MICQLYLLAALSGGILCNLLCNGDFEAYSTLLSYKGEKYKFVDSDSCWFQQSGDGWEVKEKSFNLNSLSAELVRLSPYTLCQAVHLQPGATYYLQYSLLTPKNIIYAAIAAKANSLLVLNLSSTVSESITVGHAYFVAPSVEIRICFTPFATYTNEDSFIGPCLDDVELNFFSQNSGSNQSQTNISTPSISTSDNDTTNVTFDSSSSEYNQSDENNSVQNVDKNTTINLVVQLDFQIEVRELQGQIYFWGLYKVPSIFTAKISELLKTYQKFLKVYFEGELQIDKNTLSSSSSSALDFYVSPERSYSLENIVFVLPQQIKQDQLVQIDYIITINGKQTNFYVLKKGEQNFIEYFEPISKQVMKWIRKIHNFLRGIFCSYFLFNILGFYNITLLFNFIDITNRPIFASNFLEMLSLILYKFNTLTEWIADLLSISPHKFDFTYSQLQENMEEYRYDRAWFGKMGFTTNCLANNFQSFAVLLFLILKLIALNFSLKILPKKLKIILSLQSYNPFQIWISQFIFLSPFFILSSVTSILSPSVGSLAGKINQISQITLFFGCLASPFVSHMLHKMKLKKGKQQKVIKRERNGETAQFLLYLGLPTLVVIGNSYCFILFAALITGYRLFLFLQGLRSSSVGQLVYGAIIHIIWVTYVLVHMFLLVLGHFPHSREFTKQMSNPIAISGLIIIGCVLAGSAFQIIYFTLNCFKALVTLVRRLTKMAKSRTNAISPAAQQHNEPSFNQNNSINDGKLIVETMNQEPTPTNLGFQDGKIKQTKKGKSKSKTTKKEKKLDNMYLEQSFINKIKQLKPNQALIISRAKK